MNTAHLHSRTTTFMDKNSKLRHNQSKYLGKKFTCHQCNKSYTTKANLSRHLTVGIWSKCNLNLQDPPITSMTGNPQPEPSENSPQRLLNQNDMRDRGKDKMSESLTLYISWYSEICPLPIHAGKVMRSLQI